MWRKRITHSLVGVPGTFLIGKHSQFHTVPVRRAHHTCVQIEVAQHLARLLTLSEAGDPFGHLIVEFILALLTVVHLVLVFVAFIGEALVAVNVFLVCELTGDGLPVDLLGLALDEFALAAVYVMDKIAMRRIRCGMKDVGDKSIKQTGHIYAHTFALALFFFVVLFLAFLFLLCHMRWVS